MRKSDNKKVLTFGVIAVLIIGGMFTISFISGSDNGFTGGAWWNFRRPIQVQPLGVELCDTQADDDRDGLLNCADPDCADWQRCLDMRTCGDDLIYFGRNIQEMSPGDCVGFPEDLELCIDALDGSGATIRVNGLREHLDYDIPENINGLEVMVNYYMVSVGAGDSMADVYASPTGRCSQVREDVCNNI